MRGGRHAAAATVIAAMAIDTVSVLQETALNAQSIR